MTTLDMNWTSVSSTGATIRRLVPEDYDAVVPIWAEYDPEPPSPDECRRRLENWNPTWPRLEIVAVAPDGSIIGFARSMRREHTAPGAFMIWVDSHKDWRQKGLGHELFTIVEQEALNQGGTMLSTFVRDGDEASQAFMERRGYPFERDLFESVLDLKSFDRAAFVGRETCEGITFSTIAEIGDSGAVRQKLHELASKSDTAPDIEVWGVPEYDQFEKDTFEAEGYMPEGIIIAMDGEAFVGHHSIYEGATEDQFSTDYTGTLPSHRRRGIALALKLRGIDLALSRGKTSIITHNDSENVGMLAINYALGFVKQPGWRILRKRLG